MLTAAKVLIGAAVSYPADIKHKSSRYITYRLL